MRLPLRPVLLALLLTVMVTVRGQSGISIGLSFFGAKGEARTDGLLLSFRYDHDILPHLAYGIDLGFAPAGVSTTTKEPQLDGSQVELDYRAYFLTGNNESTSFYVGSHLGCRYGKLDAYNKGSVAFPLGLRMGIRGSLDGSYGDLFVEGGYMLSSSYKTYEGSTYPTSGPLWMFGFGCAF